MLLKNRGHSTLNSRAPNLKTEILERRKIKIYTLDTVVNNQGLANLSSIGLKIDVEGAELDVLKGSLQTLLKCKFVILEVSIKKLYKGGYSFAEIIAFMDEQGFAILDILNPTGRTPSFFDCLFVPKTSSILEI